MLSDLVYFCLEFFVLNIKKKKYIQNAMDRCIVVSGNWKLCEGEFKMMGFDDEETLLPFDYI